MFDFCNKQFDQSNYIEFEFDFICKIINHKYHGINQPERKWKKARRGR